MHKLNIGIIGAGWMGRVHVENLRRLGFVEVVAVACRTPKSAERFATQQRIPFASDDYHELLASEAIDGVHICTPNHLHAPITRAALLAGKHVLCEKPLAMSADEATEMLALATSRGLHHAVNHNLRYYPAVQQARQMIAHGDLGEILAVQGTYSQDWLFKPDDYNWRVRSELGGSLRAMGDIGSHWMDMIEHVTGKRITALCADLATFHQERRSPQMPIGNGPPVEEGMVPVDTEDFGMAMLHLGDRCRGAFTVSQVAAGCKNRFEWLITGTGGSVGWSQERPDELWIGRRDGPNELLWKDPATFYPEAAISADYPVGHVEGYADTHKQLFRRLWSGVEAAADPAGPVGYPTFADGLRGMRLLEAVGESHARRGWVDCAPV